MRMPVERIAILLLTAFAVLPLSAQERFPSQPIRLIVPSAPGGGTDSTFRLLAELAEPDLGHKVVIINRPGASGSIAATTLNTSKPDGYTIAGIWGDIVTVVPHTLPVTYTPANFAPISLSVTVPLVFCVKQSFPAKNGAEFLAALKAKPDEYTYGTDGSGGAVHLAAERIFTQTGVKARMIPFTDSATILRNFLGGHIDIYGGVIGTIQQHVQSGEARCVLVSSADKNRSMPEATSLAELKLEGASTQIWRGIIGVKGTPDDRLKFLEAVFSKAAKTEQFKEFMNKQGGIAVGGSAAELNGIIQHDYEAFGKLVRELGLASK